MNKPEAKCSQCSHRKVCENVIRLFGSIIQPQTECPNFEMEHISCPKISLCKVCTKADICPYRAKYESALQYLNSLALDEDFIFDFTFNCSHFEDRWDHPETVKQEMLPDISDRIAQLDNDK